MFGLTERSGQARSEESVEDRSKSIGLSLVLMLALPVAILFLVYKQVFTQINDPDALDIAQVARNLATGRGFITNAVRPYQLTRFQDVMHMPDMLHAPLYPHVVALFLAGNNASENKVVATSCFFFVLTIPVLYLLAKGMFNQRVAFLTITAYSLSTLMITVAMSGLPGTMGTFMFTSLCYTLFRYAQESAETEDVPANPALAMKFAVASGVLMGLCYLTDYPLLYAFLPVAAFIWLVGGRGKGAGIGAFAVAFLVVSAYWMVHNATLTGHALFGLRSMEFAMGGKVHPGQSLYRSTVPTGNLALFQEDKGIVGKRLVGGVMRVYQGLPELGQPWVAAFLIVGLFYSFRRTGVNAIRGLVLVAFAFVAIFGSLLSLNATTLAAFAPIAMAFGVAFFVRLLSDSKAPVVIVKAVTTLAVVMLALPCVILIANADPGKPRPYDIEGDISHRLAKDTPILTDRAIEMAWYGSKTAVWLPNTEADVLAVDRIHKMPALYLSADLAPTARVGEDFGVWRNFYWAQWNEASRERYSNITAGTFEGYQLYRDMPDDIAKAYTQSGALLFLRPGALR